MTLERLLAVLLCGCLLLPAGAADVLAAVEKEVPKAPAAPLPALPAPEIKLLPGLSAPQVPSAPLPAAPLLTAGAPNAAAPAPQVERSPAEPAASAALPAAPAPEARPSAPAQKPTLAKLSKLAQQDGEKDPLQGTLFPDLLGERAPKAQDDAPVPEQAGPAESLPLAAVHAAAGAVRDARATSREFVKDLALGDKEFRPFLKNYQKRIALGSAFMIAVGMGGTLQSWMFGRLIDMAHAKNGTMVAALLGSYFVAHAAFVLLDVYQQKFMSRTRLALIQDVRMFLYERFLEQPKKFFDRHKSSELASRLVNDANTIPNRNINNRAALPYFVAMLAINGSMVLTTPHLGWAAAVLVPLMTGLSIRYGRRRAKLEAEYAALRAGLNKAGEAGLSAEREAKRLDAVTAQTSLYRLASERMQKTGYRITVLSLNNDYGIGFLSHFVTHFVVLGIGLYSWFHFGKPSVGEIVALTGYAEAFRSALQGLINNVYTDNKAASGMTAGLREYLREVGPAAEASNTEEVPALTQGLTVEGIEGATFEAPAGKAVGVRLEAERLGDLIMGLEKPGKGRVLWDGKPVDELPSAGLRRRVAVLDKESQLLPGTVLENFLAVRPDATGAKMLDALSLAGLDAKSLPEGLQTEAETVREKLGEAGERQLLLARAFLQDPSVVVLESPGGSLKGRDAELFDEALRRLLAGRTVLWSWPPEAWARGLHTIVTPPLPNRL